MADRRLVADMRGKVVVITGGNSGIGLAAAREIARRGATVVITARSERKGASAIDIIRRYSKNNASAVLPLDLASFDSIRAFADRLLKDYERLDVLVNNAGGLLSQRQLTQEGYEMTFGVNHLGHFLLTRTAPRSIAAVGAVTHRQRVVDRPPVRGDLVRRPDVRTPSLQPDRGVQPVEVGQRVVHPRAGASAAGHRGHGQQHASGCGADRVR